MNDEMFVLIEASKLSLTDEFMRYRPKTKSEKEFKNSLKDVIKKGIDDFYRPKMDPTLDEAGKICFKAGKRPALGLSYDWWHENAKKFNPARKSRLGTKSQYIAFLGVLIKTLVAVGWSKEKAWWAVCNNSECLGNVITKYKFKVTGSDKIVGYFDLANTRKILEDDEDCYGFWCAGEYHYSSSYHLPLAYLGFGDYCSTDLKDSVGWLVLD